MATTIQVSETTRNMLELAKDRIGARSLDEALQKVLEKQLDMPKSMFGMLKGKMKPFSRTERLDMWKH
ncbi:hypothetical protein HY640_03660 [Candidatus Woesearchaeota archaeon]|nr:hypothetical protein [Candidatus Woesearchaeota archaeon]